MPERPQDQQRPTDAVQIEGATPPENAATGRLSAEDGKPDGIYRRHFLRCGLTGTLTALAALAARPARAQDFPKMTQEQAGYQAQSTDQMCGACTLFLPPTDCKIVQGPISETGTCTYFSQ